MTELIAGRYQATELIGTTGAPAHDCDHPTATRYPDGTCGCVVCSRCGRHTGNGNQGHHWSWCSVAKAMRGPHFCCPDDCELGPVGSG